MMSNTLYFTEGAAPVLQTDVTDDAELALFVKLTEDARQRRIRAIDLGDESVRLKFNRQPVVRAAIPGGAPVGVAGQPGMQQGAPQMAGALANRFAGLGVGMGSVRLVMPGQIGA